MQKIPASQPQGVLAGSRPKDVLLGVAVDWALTIIAGVVVLLLFLDSDLWDAEEEVLNQALSALNADAAYLATTFLLGTTATVIGAYVGAKRAGVLHLKHGLAIAVLSAALALLFVPLPADGGIADIPLWYDIASWLFILPAGIFGGYLARERKERASA